MEQQSEFSAEFNKIRTNFLIDNLINFVSKTLTEFRYCTFFLKGQSCPNRDCLYLHKKAKESDCFPKVGFALTSKELVGNKAIFREQQQSVLGHLSKYATSIYKMRPKHSKVTFPNVAEAIEKLKIYCKDQGIEVTAKTKTVTTIAPPSRW